MNSIDDIKFDKKFGIITDKQIIINAGNEIENKISISSISKVKLIKKRVFYTNLAFLTTSIFAAVFLFINTEIHLFITVTLGLLSIASLVYAFIHKFYFYKIVIKLNNNTQHSLKTSQLHRKKIKEFYYAIFVKVKKNDNVSYLSSTH